MNILSPVSSELTHCWQNVCRQDNSFGRRLCTCSLHKPHRDSTAPKSSVDGTLSPLPADVSVTLSVVSASMPITGQSIYHQQITKKKQKLSTSTFQTTKQVRASFWNGCLSARLVLCTAEWEELGINCMKTEGNSKLESFPTWRSQRYYIWLYSAGHVWLSINVLLLWLCLYLVPWPRNLSTFLKT